MQINLNNNNKPAFTGYTDIPKSVAHRLDLDKAIIFRKASKKFDTKAVDVRVRVPLLRLRKKILQIQVFREGSSRWGDRHARIRIPVNAKKFTVEGITEAFQTAKAMILAPEKALLFNKRR